MHFFIARFGDVEKQHAKKHPIDSMSSVFLTDWNVSKPCTSSAFLAAIPAVETPFYCIHVKKDNRRNVNR